VWLWWLIWIVPALLIGHGRPGPSLLWYAVAIAICYVVSLTRHSNRRCRACGGSGRQRATMFPWADRMCTTCGGQSRHRRWGTQLLYRNRRTYAERTAAQARKRRGALR
jgi:hypothetical protein